MIEHNGIYQLGREGKKKHCRQKEQYLYIKMY